VDLTSFIPPDNAQVIGIPQANALAARAVAAAESADQRADDAEAAAALAASKVIDSAEFVSEQIADPDSPAGEAVAAKIATDTTGKQDKSTLKADGATKVAEAGAARDAVDARAAAVAPAVVRNLDRPVSVSSGLVLTKRYDPARSQYNATPQNGLVARAGLGAARADTGFMRIRCVGGSVTRDLSTPSIVQAKSWPTLLRNRLLALGFKSGGAGVCVAHPGLNADVLDSRWSWTGTWDFAQATIGQWWGARGTTQGGKITFTDDQPSTEVRVRHFNNAGNAVTVKIDGVSVGTITPVGGVTIGTTVFSGLLDASHTVEITLSGSFFLLHSIETKRLTGVVVDNYGASGASTKDYLAVPTSWGLKELTLVNSGDSGTQLTIVALGTNNFVRTIASGSGTTPGDYGTQLATLVDAYAAFGPVMLVAPAPAGAVVTAAQGYIEKAYEVAAAKGVRMLDLSDR
jgi:hypothetical protein